MCYKCSVCWTDEWSSQTCSSRNFSHGLHSHGTIFHGWAELRSRNANKSSVWSVKSAPLWCLFEPWLLHIMGFLYPISGRALYLRRANTFSCWSKYWSSLSDADLDQSTHASGHLFQSIWLVQAMASLQENHAYAYDYRNSQRICAPPRLCNLRQCARYGCYWPGLRKLDQRFLLDGERLDLWLVL